MITCMKMKSFILQYASKIMFYAVSIACYQESHQSCEDRGSNGDCLAESSVDNKPIFILIFNCEVLA